MFPNFKLCVKCRRQVSNSSNSNCDACNQGNCDEVNIIPDEDIIIDDACKLYRTE